MLIFYFFSDIKVLENWDASKCTNLSSMFSHSSISYITVLEKLDVLNCNNFGGMFLNILLYLI